MPEWLISILVGVVIVGLVSVIFGLLVSRLNRVEEIAGEALSRQDHERLCTERSDRVERYLTELHQLIKENDRLAIDRRHSMYGRLDEICQRLAMIEAHPGDPRLRDQR